MTSFRSRNYPLSRKRLVITQEYAMQYYAAFNIVIMLGVMVMVYSGKSSSGILWFAIIAEVVALTLGNLLAQVKLRKTYAEIFFVNTHFSLISVYEILFKQENNAFPQMYANPSLSADQNTLTIHFNDLIVNLHRDDWEDFDLIVNWMFAQI